MLEYFFHLDSNDPPDDLVLATADIADNLFRQSIEARDLPPNWRCTPAPPSLARLGDEFVENAKHGLLVVPSALATSESNWLINPQHPEFKRVIIRDVERLSYDPRMFHRDPKSRKHKRR